MPPTAIAPAALRSSYLRMISSEPDFGFRVMQSNSSKSAQRFCVRKCARTKSIEGDPVLSPQML
ncbi:hypothetical protein CK220_05905 [Mesorhizobium sp. WSM3860]|nr:hypothetical protein CK220_05905 [Mesorhizobium sp. WSM3860]